MTADKPLVGIKSDKGKFVMKEAFSMDTFEQFLKDFEGNSFIKFLILIS